MGDFNPFRNYSTMSEYPSHPPGENWMWLHLTPYSVQDMNTAPRIAKVRATRDGEELKFAIVEGWKENIAHEWGKYDSITGFFLKKWVTTGRFLHDIKGFHPSHEHEAYSAKVDEALIYLDSPRREITIDLNLAALQDPYAEVWKPVKQLQWYSSAGIDGNRMISFEWPHVFHVEIKGPGNPTALFEMKYAAMRNCDVEWKMPFIKGVTGYGLMPNVAHMTLAFQELAPLYKQTLEWDKFKDGFRNTGGR